MKNLIGKKVKAVVDHGKYVGTERTGVLSYNKTTGQYLISTAKSVMSVYEPTIQSLEK